MNSKLELGNSGSYYISEYGNGFFNNVYIGGTQLSSLFASYSHSHSGYASSSHTHSVIKNGSYDWQCSASGNLIPRTISSDSPKNIGNSTGYVNNLYYKSQTPVSSDRRIKNHIKDLSINESCLLLKGLQPKVYTFKDDDDSVIQHGLYAQDMRDYLKESGLGYISALKICVLDTEDELSTNLDYPEEKVRYGIDYSLLVSDLINGWKYHEEEISNLKSKIEELENFIKGV